MPKTFMTLEEFLGIQPTTGLVIHATADSWIKRYRAAKASWERFPDGLPVGTICKTMRAGFGGGEGIRRVVKRVDGEYYILAASLFDDREYLCDIATWWNDLTVVLPG